MSDDKIILKPFLKWAGGKSQLIPIIESVLPKDFNNGIKEYFEPFLGAGALFFHLISDKNNSIEKAYISDINEDLILTYRVIREDSENLIELLKIFESQFLKKTHENRKKELYEPIRDDFNRFKDFLNYDKYSKGHIQQAAYFIFLNKTCFNGLYRVNSKGHFNVPMGRYKKPLICDEENIRNISNVLKDKKKIIIENKSFEYWKDKITPNSFIYLDPPYMPITDTSFTSYTKSNFKRSDQENLALFYEKINNDGAKVLLSNSGITDDNLNFYKRYYSGSYYDEPKAKRYINSDGKNRGSVNEILIRNYKLSHDNESNLL